ncbi:protein NO VEIN domain-containing protein [Streptomyces sp. NPDC091416]|uniref:protein NO VEIN domain-containing protein n=1 Tax=Streptomyces sp. NPDC091416 TaxID=3366003 RepID=UPI00381E6A23
MPSLPTEATRRAALRWLDELRVAGVPRVRALFTHHPWYSDLTPAQYAEGLAWLRRAGMVTAAGRPVVDVGDCGLSGGGERASVPRVLWSQEADAARRAVGAAGEQALLRLFRDNGVPHVRHVAAESDAYGYDIQAAGSVLDRAHIEVKSTTDPTRLVIHLSRHEYEVMSHDEDWCLAAVLVGSDGSAVNVATVSRRWLHSAVPADRTTRGHWESVRLDVPAYALTPGLMTQTWQPLPDSVVPVREVWNCPPAATGAERGGRSARQELHISLD